MSGTVHMDEGSGPAVAGMLGEGPEKTGGRGWGKFERWSPRLEFPEVGAARFSERGEEGGLTGTNWKFSSSSSASS